MSISITKHIMTWAKVDISVEELAAEIEFADLHKIAAIKSTSLNLGFGFGDGDAASLCRLINDAERSLRAMGNAPRELLDLMYYVHGRAIA